MASRGLHEENRQAWNAATEAHNSHKADQAAFLKAGGSTLFPEEIELLGDVGGKTVVHLQCNAGQDTLSLARRGAVVTGVDISDTAIAFARQLAVESGIPATFERADLYDWFNEARAAGRRFDVAFSSYGFLYWLSDLPAWATGVAATLKPGGRFVAVEFHPILDAISWDWRLTRSYFTDGEAHPIADGVGDYVALSGSALTPSGWRDGVADFRNPHRAHGWTRPLSEIITALIAAGLTLTALREYPYMNGAKLRGEMREEPGRRMIPPSHVPSLPLMFGLVARKP